MGKGRKNSHNGRHSQDNDDSYIDYRYINDDEYNDPRYEYFEGDFDEQPPQRTSRQAEDPFPITYPRSRYHRQDLYEDEYDDYRQQPNPRRQSPAYPRKMRRVKPQKRRGLLPTFLVGCLIGMLVIVGALAALVYLGITTVQNGGHITGIPGISTRAYLSTVTQRTTLPQLQTITVCNNYGNITMQVDPNATQATLVARKTVQASSQTDADQQLKATSVEMQPPGTINKPLTCTSAPAQTSNNTTSSTGTPTAVTTASSLVVNTTVPKPTSDSVDLTITLPPGAIQSTSPSLVLDVESQQGNINLTGLSGILQVHGVNGNVSISHAVLASGSKVETGQGNISFNGFLLLPTAATSDTTSTQQPIRYLFQNEKGNIDVTLPANTNLTLDANTNVGAIKSDFKIPVNNNGGPVNYHGPLNSSAGTPAAATLVLDVSTGDVHIMKVGS